MLYKTGFVSISPTVAEWQATQKCVTDRHKIFPLTAIAPILNGGWGQYKTSAKNNVNSFILLNIIYLFTSRVLNFYMTTGRICQQTTILDNIW